MNTPTPYAKLTQWEASDKPQMSTFNEDNRKIDDALSKLNQNKANLSGANFSSLSQNGFRVLDAGNPLLVKEGLKTLAVNTKTEILKIHCEKISIGGQLIIISRAYNETSSATYQFMARIDIATLKEIGYVNATGTAGKHLTITAEIENYISPMNYDVVFYATSTQFGYASATFVGINDNV